MADLVTLRWMIAICDPINGFMIPIPHLFLDKLLHFFLLWKLKLVFGIKEAVIHPGKLIFYQRMVTLCAEEDADWPVVHFGHHGFLSLERPDR